MGGVNYTQGETVTVMRLVEGGGRTQTGRDQVEDNDDEATTHNHESQHEANRLNSGSKD